MKRNYGKLLEKAVNLIESGKVRYEGKGWYKVKGEHGDYEVNLADLSCTCEWFSLHQKPCSHLLAVWLLDRLGERFFEEHSAIEVSHIKNSNIETDEDKAWYQGYSDCFERVVSIQFDKLLEELRLNKFKRNFNTALDKGGWWK